MRGHQPLYYAPCLHAYLPLRPDNALSRGSCHAPPATEPPLTTGGKAIYILCIGAIMFCYILEGALPDPYMSHVRGLAARPVVGVHVEKSEVSFYSCFVSF